MNEIKKLIKLFNPSIFIRPLDKTNLVDEINQNIIPAKYGWFGYFSSWSDAQNECTGYNAEIILEKVKNALSKVKNGEAVYERDSVLFDEIQYSFPLLSGLMWIAAQKNGELNIIDFGGSLGTTYFQNKLFLKDLKKVNWNIVEQKEFVEIGKKEFETNEVKFFFTIDESLKCQKIPCILLSSVIQYIEKPFDFIDRLLEYNFEFIIIDRTAFIEGETDRITLQKVPPEIYEASYPAWFFNRQKFINKFSEKYNLIVEFDSKFTDPIQFDNLNAYWTGFIFKKDNE